jgi:KDO2-lipid IV(A) lauroyltransferase
MDNALQAGLGWQAVWGAVGQAGRMSAELPRLWLGRTPPLAWADDRAAAQAYAQGQGVLFLTPHMGCFEVTAQALALRFGAQHGQLTVLYRPARLAALNEVMAAISSAGDRVERTTRDRSRLGGTARPAA